MEWSAIVNLIDAQLLIVVAACWVLGYIIKQTPKVPDWSIVYIVTLFAVVFVVMLTGFSAQAVLQGILCGAAAVYGNQLVKQTAIAKQEVVEKKQADKVEPKPVADPGKVEDPVKPVEQPKLVEDKPAVEQPKPLEQPQVTSPAEAEQPKQTEDPTEVKPTPAQPAEQPHPAAPALTVLTQADISKPAATTAEFAVSEDGTISVVGDIPAFGASPTAVLFPADKKSMTFTADEALHWLVAGIDEALDKMAVIGFGSLNNNIANVMASTKAIAFKAGYTKVDLDETHVFGPGKEYKLINNDDNVEFYYKDGEIFKLWYRVVKEAVELNNGETMAWLTPRLGAIVGISEVDKTNNNVLVEVKLEGAGHGGKDTGGSL